jgi:hypothetical protein
LAAFASLIAHAIARIAPARNDTLNISRSVSLEE